MAGFRQMAGGWLENECLLLGQDQLSLACQAQVVLFACVVNDDFSRI
jgi:hypothetical protein